MHMLKIDDGTDLRPVLKAWSIMFGALFMPGIFSRLVYDPSGSNDIVSKFFADTGIAVVLLIFMLFAIPALWFLDTKFAVIPSKIQCYIMILLSLGTSYLAGYIAFGAPLMAAVLFASAICVVTISVLKRYAWYVDDLIIFSIIAKK